MKFRILFKSFNNDLINLSSLQLRNLLLQTECKIKGIVSLPTRIKRFCVLRSPHIDKDSREHFELRIYKRFIDLETNTPSVINLLLKADMPSGVFCKLMVVKN